MPVSDLPEGFTAAGVHCGIKEGSDKFDVAVFACDGPATAAGVFTTNLVCGAPVKISRERVPRKSARAVVISSGNANACTGSRGDDDARWMTSLVADGLKCSAEDVLVCSTGVIGRFLPRERLAVGIPHAVRSLAGGNEALQHAATAMMTTDTFAKTAFRKVNVGGQSVRIAGVAKGAAMIGPNMATMLSVILTDATLEPAEADRMLRQAVNGSFNCISVEGHMSTSDTVLLLSSNRRPAAVADSDRQALQAAIDETAAELAQAIIRDAEGAGHFITVDIRGLRTRDEAKRIAKTIADSVLVKTAIAGADPNWGRIISAAGYAGVELREADMTLRLNGVLLYREGAPVDFDIAAVSRSLKDSRDTTIELDFVLGKESIRFWMSDLTAEYVRLNAEYTT